MEINVFGEDYIAHRVKQYDSEVGLHSREGSPRSNVYPPSARMKCAVVARAVLFVLHR